MRTFSRSIILTLMMVTALHATTTSCNFTTAEKDWIAKNPVLKVGHTLAYPPYSYATNSIPIGFIKDYTKLMASKVGFKLEFVKTSLSDQLNLLETGQLDLITTLDYDSTKTNLIKYCAPCRINDLFIVCRKTRNDIKSFHDIAYLNLGVITNTLFTKIIKQTYSNIELNQATNNSELILGLLSGENDAIVIDIAVFNHIATEKGLSNLKLIPFSSRKAKVVYWTGVNILSTNLYPILKKAYAAITTKEHSQLEANWFASPRINKSRYSAWLSEQDRSWLKENSIISVAIATNETSLISNHLFHIKNFFDDLAKRYNLLINIIECSSLTKCKQLIKDNKVMCYPSFGIFSTNAPANDFHVKLSESIPLSVLSKNPTYKHENTTAIINNRFSHQHISDALTSNLVIYSSLKECLTALNSNDIDQLLEITEGLINASEGFNRKHHLIEYTNNLYSANIYLTINSKHHPLISLIKKSQSESKPQHKTNNPTKHNSSDPNTPFFKALFAFALILLVTSLLAKLLTSFIDIKDQKNRYSFILLSVLATFVVLVCTVAFFTFKQYQKYNHKVVSQIMQKQLEVKHILISDIVNNYIFQVNHLANDITFQKLLDSNAELNSNTIKSIVGKYILGPYHNYVLVDQDLNLIYESQVNSFRNRHPEKLKEALSKPFIACSILPSALVSDHNKLSITRPIHNASGDIIAHLIFTFDKSNIDLLCQDMPYRDNSYFLIFDIEGHLISRNPFKLNSNLPTIKFGNQQNKFTRMASSAIQGESGSDINGYINTVGKQVIGTWHWDPMLNLGFAIEYDMASYNDNFVAINRIFLICIISVILASIIIAIIILAYNSYFSKTIIAERSKWERIAESRLFELKRLADRLGNMFRKSPVPFYSLDNAGYIIDCNEQFSELIGYQRNDLINTLFTNYCAPEEIASFNHSYSNMKIRGDAATSLVLISKSHKQIPILLYVKAQYDKSNVFSSSICVMVDNSHHLKIEAERLRFLNFFNNIPGFAYTCNKDGNVILANQNLAKYLNLEQSEVQGKNILNCLPAEMSSKILKYIAKVFTSSEFYTIEYQVQTANGEPRYYTSHIFPVIREMETFESVAIITNDITAFRLAKEKLKFSQAIFKLMVDNAQSAIFLKRLDGTFSIVNPSFKNIFAADAQIIDHVISDFVTPEIAKVSCASDAQVISTRKDTNYEIDIYDRTFLVQKFPFYGPSNDIEGVGGIAMDITDLVSLQQELKEKHALLKIETKNAKAATEAKSRFLANMSHEIRTPLNAIYGSIYRLSQSSLGLKSDNIVSMLNTATDQLIRIVDDILDISKIEAGKLKLENNSFSLAKIIKDTLFSFKESSSSKNISLDYFVDPDIPDLLIGDDLRIKQILYNLISNSIKFTAVGGIKIHVYLLETSATHVMLNFAIYDTGIGMTKEQISRASEPFSQGDESTTRKYGGTGLGLSITNNLLTMMDSELEIESKPARGTCCSFIINLDIEHQLLLNSARDITDIVIPDLSDYKILVVEDNIINQEILTEFLNDTLANITVATNGLNAVELTTNEYYDLILMDIHMPGMDGLEATKYIRQNEQKKNIIIALTAAVFEEDIQRALDAGMNDQINKPVMPNILYNKLAKWLKCTKLINPVSPTDEAKPAQPVILEIDGMDYQANLERMMYNCDLVKAMLTKFANNHANDWQALEKALDAKDYALAHKIIHTVKGTAGMLDAKPLNQAALKLELAIKNQTKDYSLKFEDFKHELTRFVNAINSTFNNN